MLLRVIHLLYLLLRVIYLLLRVIHLLSVIFVTTCHIFVITCHTSDISPVFVGDLPGTLLADLPLLLEVGLVAAQHDVGLLAVRVGLQLRQPVARVHERLLARHVEQQQEAHRVTEKRRRQAAEPGERDTGI